MTEYYFDIETESLDPQTSKLITIQFQRLSTRDGSPEGELTIWKTWERGEKDMIMEFHNLFYEKTWDFIPIGQNLLFDFYFLNSKVQQYMGRSYGLDFFKDKPFIDIKPTLIMKNYGSFRGYDQLLGKTGESAMLKLASGSEIKNTIR